MKNFQLREFILELIYILITYNIILYVFKFFRNSTVDNNNKGYYVIVFVGLYLSTISIIAVPLFQYEHTNINLDTLSEELDKCSISQNSYDDEYAKFFLINNEEDNETNTNSNDNETNTNSNDNEENTNSNDNEENTNSNDNETNTNSNDNEENTNSNDNEENTNSNDNEENTNSNDNETNTNSNDNEEKSNIDQNLSDINESLKEDYDKILESNPNDIVSLWGIAINFAWNQLERDKMKMESEYRQVKTENISDQKKFKYKEKLISWYYDEESRILSVLDHEKIKLSKIGGILLKYKDNPEYDTYVYDYYTLDSSILEKLNISEPPKRNKIDIDSKLIIFIAGWLIKTKYMPFALIVGIFGFGLLGSSISNLLLNNKDNSKSKTSINSTYIFIVIRGFTASLLAFLALKGGLIILSVNSNLNPYALYFICFISAVYSQYIWNWAKLTLEKLLKSTEKKGWFKKGV
jgi:hypothetical protein